MRLLTSWRTRLVTHSPAVKPLLWDGCGRWNFVSGWRNATSDLTTQVISPLLPAGGHRLDRVSVRRAPFHGRQRHSWSVEPETVLVKEMRECQVRIQVRLGILTTGRIALICSGDRHAVPRLISRRCLLSDVGGCGVCKEGGRRVKVSIAHDTVAVQMRSSR